MNIDIIILIHSWNYNIFFRLKACFVFKMLSQNIFLIWYLYMSLVSTARRDLLSHVVSYWPANELNVKKTINVNVTLEDWTTKECYCFNMDTVIYHLCKVLSICIFNPWFLMLITYFFNCVLFRCLCSNNVNQTFFFNFFEISNFIIFVHMS